MYGPGGSGAHGSSRNEPQGDKKDGRIEPPILSLPKGGGAIRGIGEKFAANPVTGTGSISVPIATSSGRSGFGPQLSLSYDSGAGNGPFGLGWSLSTPSITRKTDKGLPRYLDADESDVFILSGAEDLVPVLVKDGEQWVREILPTRTVDGREYRVQRYRPRIEGLFARIERWTNIDDAADTFWRSISRDNIATWYGRTAESRIADPAEPARVFSWLVCETCDDKGNVIAYTYKREDSARVELDQAHERNRTDQTRSANCYLKRVRYGNRTPYFPEFAPDQPPTALPDDSDWMFEIVFDYGEHDPDEPQPGDDPADSNSQLWPVRNDPFSSYRAGFEIRTYRLCQRVLTFHHFPDEPDVRADCLVRSTDFTYSFEEDPADARNPIFSLLRSVTQSGYKRQAPGSPSEYLKKSLPPVEFTYSEATIQDEVHEVDPESLENLPYGVDGASYQWVDLDGEGVSGILTEQAGGWFYKRNLSPVPRPSHPAQSGVEARFAPVELVASVPAATFAAGQAQFMDLAGDGQADLVQLNDPVRGFYERTLDSDWITFRPFRDCPNLDTRDPNLRFIDLDGDGHTDILITEDEVFRWHASLAEDGFGPAQFVRQNVDEERGPRLVFAEAEQSIYLADLSGDGLTDLVRIRNGEVCYWPNLGYGRFGAKVTMDRAPIFDYPDHFEQRRIRLGDIDGSGTTDIFYLAHGGITIWRNQSGNSWSEPERLTVLPPIDGLSSVAVVDLLGNGTACLVWSSPLPGDAGRQMRYVDLMGGQKPHLLVATKNNLGAETRVHYASSTKFYLADALTGRPWITRLPFPVHVAERVETFDHISRNLFVTRYVYHHGYFDGEEREFRGFGMVEQFDTEEFGALSTSGDVPTGDNIDAASHVPPTVTRTWFHTGVHIGRNHVSDFFAGLLDEQDVGEYYREPGLTDAQARALLLEDTVLPAGLTVEEEREACRSLKGSMLRQETYALDGTDKEQHPFTVAEQNFTIRPIQPRAGNRHGVFFTHAREAVTSQYERNPTDPRTSHALTLEVDEFGNVLKSAAIGYGRRQPDVSLSAEDQAKQTQTHATYTEGDFTNPITKEDAYRTPLPCETRSYELTGYTPSGAAGRFRMSDFAQPDANGRVRHIFDSEISYEEGLGSGRQRRLIEQVRTLYRPDDLGFAQNNDPLALLPLGAAQPLALPGESYQLAFTPGLLAQVYQRDGQPLLPDRANVLGGQGADRGGYLQSEQLKADGRFPNTDPDDHWWIPAGRVLLSPGSNDTAAEELAYARQHFFLPHRYRNPFHTDAVNTESFVAYDDYDLLLLETRDALENRITAGERTLAGEIDPGASGNDYRVLQPRLVMDPNRNRTEVRFDALGMVVGIAIMGKPAPAPVEGDSLEGFEADLTEAQVDGFYDAEDPHEPAPSLLKEATTRIIYDLECFRRSRQEHPDEPEKWQPAYAATLARETHVSDPLPPPGLKIQISFSYSDGFGREIQKKIQAEPGPVVGGEPDVDPRWVSSGWTIFNNKGNPVRQYEPFFSPLPEKRHQFEFGNEVGVSPVLFYDPVGRVVATLHPNHTWQKVVFDPWRQESWDVSDTVLVDDPASDSDVSDFFRRLPDDEYLPTWHAQRQSGALGPHEQAAAVKSALHAETPTVAHFDSLGRTFLTVAHNKFKHSDTPAGDPPTEEFYETHVIYDIEGNERTVVDAKQRVVMRYDYDMLGNRIHQASMEAGERWMLSDVAGQPIRAWDSRDREFRTAYDPLRRPKESFLREGADAEFLVGRTVYGETQADPETNNLRGQVVQLFDQAGIVTSDEYDFKGNLLRSRRQLARDYKTTLDWSASVPLEADIYVSRSLYDALNGPIQLIAPRSDQPGARRNVIQPSYNEANLLERVDVWLDHPTEPTELIDAAAIQPAPVGVSNIDYDAKGQRTRIEYGNGARTTYQYDPLTFRLTQLKTTRPAGLNGLASQIFADPTVVQDLRYTFDPVGNITRIEDAALSTVFHNGQQIEPVSSYAYDALYRLVEAEGREHVGQTAHDFNSPDGNYRDYPFVGHRHPNDPQALRNYTERYEYDAVGNFEMLRHLANSGSWTRHYDYEEDSFVESANKSNRLTRTMVGNGLNHIENYTYDAHGNMISMPHLPLIRWNFRDQLQATSQQAVNNGGAPETTCYVYDGAGQRVRKVTERQSAAGQTPTRKEERIYLGAFEIYRKYENDGATVTLERETLHVMDDKQRIALVETRTLDTAGDDPAPRQLIRYQFGNHLGSAGLELNEQGKVISYEEYTPYGNTSYQAVRSQRETPKRYKFTGVERDEESGLNYHGARYYAAWLGRWTVPDPAGFVDGVNPYTYARNQPIVLFDPSGADAEKPAGIREDSLRITKFDKKGQAYERTIHFVVPKHIRDVEQYKEWAREQGIQIVGEVSIEFEKGERIFTSEWFVLPEEQKEQKEEEDSWWWSGLKFGIELVGPGKIKWAFRAVRLLEGEDPVDVVTDIVLDKVTGGKKVRASGGKGRTGSGQPSRRAASEGAGRGERAGASKPTRRSEHAEHGRLKGRRVGPAFNDAKGARQSDVFVQPDGRYVVRGPKGREHIFEPDGTLVTTIDRSHAAHLGNVKKGNRSPITAEAYEAFKALFR